ncbi:hypothetical protein MNBD_GAMMA21-654 [hydrothermal vent metagenome]|uniref:HTH araC/xylS-type domain-containing protein n=1 Tax=hydrothermal vent metagenome TaxID=652676 RepID=A0A3B1AF90_9ZZZZ
MVTLSILSIGFSIISAAILFIAYVFFLQNVNKSWFAISSCAGILLGLSFLQLGHLDFLINNTDVLYSGWYRFWLYLSPTMFFFFSRATLLPDARLSPLLILHFAPSLLNLLDQVEIGVPLIFLIGMGYSVWLANLIFGLRAQRKRFKIEMFFFALFSIIALLVLIIGVAVPYIDNAYFYLFYTHSIGISFILIVAALIVFPDLLDELAEVAKISYAASTLSDVNIKVQLEKLEQLMKQEQMYQNENLSLSMVAATMELTAHQLSELVNVQFGMNFSRYIREQRIAAAKKLLINEPGSSILAIGLETGFKSQSNFYAAFKEITGLSPGSYRKSLSE